MANYNLTQTGDEVQAYIDSIPVIDVTGTLNGSAITFGSNPYSQIAANYAADCSSIVRLTVGTAVYLLRVAQYDGTNYTAAEMSGAHNVVATIGSSSASATIDAGIDATPTQDSDNLVKSGGVYEEVSQLHQKVIYDVSANNDRATFASLSALLTSKNLSTLIPIAVRCGGMSIRFVQSSDNKYVQYRLMSNTFNTTVANWQGVDDKPTAGSDNLVKSGGVSKSIIEGTTIYTFDYSQFASKSPNITLPSAINLTNVGDYIELDVNPNGTGYMMWKTAAYNRPCIQYATNTVFAIRFLMSMSSKTYAFTSANNNKRQKIRIVLDSTDGTNNIFKCYIDDLLVITQEIAVSKIVSYDLLGGNILMKLYSLKFKSGGNEGSYTKFSEIQGADGVTDIYETIRCYGLEELTQIVDELDEKINSLPLPSNMYYEFVKNSTLYNAESSFAIYQRIYGNVYTRSYVVLYNNVNDDSSWGYWRLERTSIGTLIDGVFTESLASVLTAGENEFVLQWADGAEYNYDSGFSGGFHFGEKIGDAGTFVNFIADGNILDLSADITLTPCSEFYYKELSAIYQKVAGTIACYHYKETHFEKCGYRVFNEVRMTQALDFWAFFGIVCVGRNISQYAMPEDVHALTDMGTGTPGGYQFQSNKNRIHYQGNGYSLDVNSHILMGDDDSLNSLKVWNVSSYNKYYRATQTIEGSILNCVIGETSVRIYPT